GASSGTVTVTAPSDVYAGTPVNVSATIASEIGRASGRERVRATPAATTITDVVETTTVSLSANASVAEGGTITYTASLNHPAAVGSPVTVTLSNGETITIAGGASSGTVTVTAPSDVYAGTPVNVSATIAS